mmetsp:Transcript_25121/g.61168  ORF Transcript_25121/g.61168 Transcript_25121/m.61168 type:complete len:336 (-) Transcript_25121:195-1202(-)
MGTATGAFGVATPVVGGSRVPARLGCGGRPRRHVGCAGLRAVLRVDETGRVPVATPFGIVPRDPLSLPPMVSLAWEQAEKATADTSHSAMKRRLSELEPTLEGRDVSRKLAALQELNFFPPEIASQVLLKCADDSVDELVRSQAMFTAVLYLRQIMEASQETEVELQNQPCFQAVVGRLSTDGSPTVRSAAAGALGQLRGEAVLRALERSFMEEKDWLVQMSVAVSLGSLSDERATPSLRKALNRFDPKHCENDSLVVQGVVGALGQLGAEEAIDDIIRFAHSNDMLVRQQVAEALQAFADERAAAALETMLDDEFEVVRLQASRSLAAVREMLK